MSYSNSDITALTSVSTNTKLKNRQEITSTTATSLEVYAALNNDQFTKASKFPVNSQLREVHVSLQNMILQLLTKVGKSTLIGLHENIGNMIDTMTPNMKNFANTIEVDGQKSANIISTWSYINLLMPSFKNLSEDIFIDKANNQTIFYISIFSLLLEAMVISNLYLAPLAVEKMSKTWQNADPNIIGIALNYGVIVALDELKHVMSKPELYNLCGFDSVNRDINLYQSAWNIATTYTAQFMLSPNLPSPPPTSS